MQQKLVKVGDVAKHFGVTRQTIHSWVALGMPCYKRDGMHTRYDLTECDEWVRCRG